MTDRYKEIESLMTEVSLGLLTQERIEIIDSFLNECRNDQDACQDALVLLTKYNYSSSLQFFALSILELWISKRWNMINPDQQNLIIHLLFDYAINHHKSLPHHVVNYLLKVLACLGRVLSRPEASHWMNQILSWMHNQDTCWLGASLLQIVSEEWTHPSTKISTGDRMRLKNFLVSHLPSIFDLYHQALHALWHTNIAQGTENGELVYILLDSLQHFLSWAPINLALQPDKIETIFQFVLLNNRLSIHSLQCINEILERNFFPPNLEPFLRQLHNLALTQLKYLQMPNTIQSIGDELQMKWIQFIHLFVQVHLCRDPHFNLSEFLMWFGKYTLMQDSLKNFLECLDIWEVILTIMLTNKEKQISIEPFKETVIDFLTTLYQSACLRYNGERLSTLEAKNVVDERAFAEDEETCELDSYIRSVLSLLSQAYMCYPESWGQLLNKFMEPIRDFGKINEWILEERQQRRQRHQLGQSLPSHHENDVWLVNQIYTLMKDTHTSIQAIAVIGSQFCQFFELTFDDTRCLIRTLIDLTLYVLRNRIYDYNPVSVRFSAELFGAMRAFSEWLNVFLTRLHLHQGPSEDFQTLLTDLVQCDLLVLNMASRSQLNGSYTAMDNSKCGIHDKGHDVSIKYDSIDGTGANSSPSPGGNERSNPIHCQDAPCDVSNEGESTISDIITLSAAVHLNSLISSVKYASLLHLEPIGRFLTQFHQIVQAHQGLDTRQHLYAAATLIYLTPWPNVPSHQQEWSVRAVNFDHHLQPIIFPYQLIARGITDHSYSFSDLIEYPTWPTKQDIKTTVIHTLDGLIATVRACRHGQTNKKGLEILWMVLEKPVACSIEILPYTFTSDQTGDLELLFRLLQLFSQLFETLGPLLNSDTKAKMIETTVATINHTTLVEGHPNPSLGKDLNYPNGSQCPTDLGILCSDENGPGQMLVFRLLTFFHAVVCQSNAPYLEAILELCIDQLFPLIYQQLASPDVEQAFYDLMGIVLVTHYGFLLNSAQDPPFYIRIMNCFHFALQQQDYNTFNLVMRYLMEAQEKRRLFETDIFWKHDYTIILSRLFDTIVNRTHKPVQEMILKMAYQVIQGAGFDAFFDQFLDNFLGSKNGSEKLGLTQNQLVQLRETAGRETDMPTLSKNLENMLNDLSAFRDEMAV